MKKNFSPHWIRSKQPRKQRKYRIYAPLHLRQKMMSAHLSKVLRKEYKSRSIPVRTGDEVTVIAGDSREKSGKVAKVDLKKMKIYVEGVTIKKVTGQEVQIALDPSNVVITKLSIDDKKRRKFIKRKDAKTWEKKPEPKKEEKKTDMKKEAKK